MKKFGMAIAVGALGLMAACGGGDKGKMKKMKEAMCACKDAACVDKVQKDYADFMKSMEEKYKGDKKPDEDMMKIGEEMAKCMSDAMAGGAGGASDTGAGSASASGAGSASASGSAAASGSDTASGSAAASGGTASADTGVPECDDYLKAFDKYMSCDKIPQQAKDASKSGIEQMKQGWAMLKDPNVPAEAKKAAGDACKQAVDALKQSASAMGCAL